MDLDFLLWLQNLREAAGGVLDGFIMAITNIVGGTALYIFIGFIYWCIDKRAGALMCMSYGFTGILNQIIKNTVCVYRPWIRNPDIKPLEAAKAGAKGYSFPSGHAQLSTAVFGTTAVWQKKRKWVVVLCVLIVLLVMFSRLYVGVHTPQDVIVGCALSIAVILLDLRLMDWIDKDPKRDLIVFAVGCVVCAAYLAYTTLKPYHIDYAADGSMLVDPAEMIAGCYSMAGSFLGFFGGWVIERRFVKFEPAKKIWQKIVSFVGGAALLILIIKVPVKAAMKALAAMGTVGLCASKGLQTFVLFLFISLIYPAIMKGVSKLVSKK